MSPNDYNRERIRWMRQTQNRVETAILWTLWNDIATNPAWFRRKGQPFRMWR